MSDDDPLEEVRRRMAKPLPPEELERIETLIEFEMLIDPGHWCAACGQEQPAGPACPECYDTRSYIADRAEVEQRRAVLALMTPADLRDLSWLWRQ